MAIKYLANKRMQGTAAERTALNLTTPPATSWKELGRTTLSSAGDSINVASFAAKDNLMILTHAIQNGVIIPSYQFNGDTGNNYVIRHNMNGGSDGTAGGGNKIQWSNAGTDDDNFGVGVINNISNKEKFVYQEGIKSDTGAGNAPNSEENIGKWANTSAQITTVNVMNTQSGDFNTGSEVVVLGCDDDEADSGTNFWQELASVELTSAGDVLDTGTFTAKKYLMIQWQTNPSGGNTDDIKCHFNADTGSNYAYNRQVDGASSETFTSTANFRIDAGNGAYSRDGYAYIINKSGKEKLLIGKEAASGNEGAGNAPRRFETYGKWTGSAQITRIQLTNQGTGDFKIGSQLKVWGAD